MYNPFETIDARLSNIEGLLDLKHPPIATAGQPAPDQFLTIREAGELLHLSVPTIYGLVSRSEIPVSKRGKRLYFSKQELTEWVKAGRKKTHLETAREADTYFVEPQEKGAEMRKHNNPQDKGQSKDNTHFTQLQTIFKYLLEHVATASMVADATEVPQKNICRYKRDLEKAGRLWEITKAVCKKTGFKAWYLTTDQSKAPKHLTQLTLF